MAQKDVGNKIPIYKLKTTDEVMKYYDEWGDKDKYNKDMVDWNYTGPKETADTFNKYEKNKDTLIFDKGLLVQYLIKFEINRLHENFRTHIFLIQLQLDLFHSLHQRLVCLYYLRAY